MTIVVSPTTIVVSPTVYPDNYYCPSLQGYSFNATHDVSETKMQNGWTVRRRREPFSIRTASLTFEMNSTEFLSWYQWAVDNAYNWIRIRVQTELTNPSVGPNTGNEVLRFTSPISYSYNDWGWVTAQVQCEFYLDPVAGTFQ